MNYNKNTDVNESEFEDIRQYQEITDADTIIDLLGDVVVLNRFKNNFDYLYNRTVDVAALCWNNRDEQGNKLQHTLIKFKVDVDDKMVYALALNRFMISLVFIKTIVQYIDDVNIDDFILSDYLSKKMREKIQDKIVETLLGYGYSIKEVQAIMAQMSLDLKELLLVFSHADMQIFTAENLFLNHYRDSEIIREINNTEYPGDMQTSEIVEENKRRYEILEAEMIRLGNKFFIDNKYTNIIKPKQMEELYINFSQIPDGKDILPTIMNGNGFKAGYHDLDVFYAGTVGAKVPEMMNEEHMGTAGYFNRNLMILTYGTLSKTVYDCGSVNPIPITVDEVVLEMMEGRFYYTSKNSGILHVLKKTDTHLIGKELWFRSPCTCNLNEDCCRVCYGTNASKVGDLNGGFIYTTELMTSRISQNILSAKHLLKTNAKKINFSEGFDNYFIIESSTIIPNDEKKFDIYIREDYQDNMSESLTIYIGKELKPLTISNYANISIPDEIFDKAKEVLIDDVSYYKINSYKILEMGGTFCMITPINIMMTQKYMDIMRLFETGITKFEKVEDVVVTLMRLLHKTIPILSTHGEIIIGKLLRDVDNKLLRPNFLIPDVPYQMLNLKTALANIESATTAISFEQTKRHLLYSIFDERNKIKRVGPHGFTDYLYGEEYL
jgi:hypothetical protein